MACILEEPGSLRTMRTARTIAYPIPIKDVPKTVQRAIFSKSV
jgi:hypothetical protein